MNEDTDLAARQRLLADILGRTGLPNAPMAMPKQVLEAQPRWLFSIYSRLLRRV